MPNQNKSSGAHLVRVDDDRAGQRLDNFLSAKLKGVPRSAVYRMIRTGQVRVNGGRKKAATRLEAGDEVRIPPAHTREPGEFRVSRRVIEQVEQSILYENQDLLVVDKPSGMAVHAGSGLPWGLIDALRQGRPDEFLELVHRLDRETSGCLALARNGASLRHYSSQFREGVAEKRYLCLLEGRLPEALVEVNAPLLKAPGAAQGRVEVHAGGKAAITRFHLLGCYKDCSYAEAELLTGRTHQIRAHARSIGQPLAGDELYAERASLRKWKKRGLKRLFLHAHQLTLRARDGNARVLNAALPGPLRRVLDTLES